jgi:hypothetical protein
MKLSRLLLPWILVAAWGCLSIEPHDMNPDGKIVGGDVEARFPDNDIGVVVLAEAAPHRRDTGDHDLVRDRRVR